MESKQPLWKQTLDKIKSKIQNEYEIGDLLPGDIELIEMYGVSRITIRRALDELANQGIIKRERGKGTVVIDKYDRLQTVVKSSSETLIEHDMKSRNLEVIGYTNVDQIKILNFFGLDKPCKLLKIERSSTKGSKKIATFITYINPVVKLSTNENFTDSLYDLLESKNYKITRFEETITTSICTAEEQKKFNAENLIPILSRQRRGYSGDVPVEYTIASYNGEEYSMVVENSFV